MNLALARRALAEFLGTAVLVAAVVGSGVMARTPVARHRRPAARSTPWPPVAALGVLISVLGPVSGAHFNPAVTLVALVRRELGLAEGGRYVAAQLLGAVAGAALADLMFGLPAWQRRRMTAPVPAYSSARWSPPPGCCSSSER